MPPFPDAHLWLLLRRTTGRHTATFLNFEAFLEAAADGSQPAAHHCAHRRLNCAEASTTTTDRGL